MANTAQILQVSRFSLGAYTVLYEDILKYQSGSTYKLPRKLLHRFIRDHINTPSHQYSIVKEEDFTICSQPFSICSRNKSLYFFVLSSFGVFELNYRWCVFKIYDIKNKKAIVCRYYSLRLLLDLNITFCLSYCTSVAS